MRPKPEAVKLSVAYLSGRRTRNYSLLGLCAALIVVAAVATSIGSVKIPLLTTCRILLDRLPFVDISPTWQSTIATIVLEIRLPRVILAGLVGAALAIAGATYQGLFRNPLADPYLIGVAQGASLGAIVGFLLPTAWNIAGFGIIPLLAFIGALLATVIVYALARVGKTLPVTTLILSGVALSALLGSIVSYLIISSGEKMHGIIFWLMGSFSMSQWSEVRIVLPYVAVGTAVIIIFARLLNVMQLDEEQARQLGVNVERVKLLLIGVATLATAAAVSVAGVIGFVGLIVPHFVRLLWGPDHRQLLPLSMVLGAAFLILADVPARTINAPSEIPVGIITALCGTPFFLLLLRLRQRSVF